MKTELLSPAKNLETAIAAIDCGADAVYIGAMAFGARQNASNSLEDIEVIVSYAHKFWVKVYVTVNTILTDAELNDAVELVKKLDKIGVDGIIVQDVGLIQRLSEEGIEMPLHISTQCDNRDTEKINFWNKLGVSRAVLARELSLDKIKEIHKNNPNLELEFFVHGALCVSYSGQCYLSQYIGGRSANRGECAQPCRKKYTIIDESDNIIAQNVYPLCLKDFNASNHIEEMVKAGVYSFKIEGRLKDVGYVKNITAYYRQELDKFSEKSSSGKSFIEFVPNPEKSFNRGFTNYFLAKRGECYNFYSPKSRGEMLGTVVKSSDKFIIIKTDKQIHNQDGLCYYANGDLEGFLVNKTEVKDRNAVAVYPNKKTMLRPNTQIYRNCDIEFEKLLSKPVKRKISINLTYKDGVVIIKDEDGISIKQPIDSDQLAKNSQKMQETFVKQFSKTGDSDFYVEDIKLLSALPFLPVSQINELRRNALEKLMRKRLDMYKRPRQKPIRCAKYYKSEDDYHANVLNNSAKSFYEKCGCHINEFCPEKEFPERQIELMRTKHCIKFALNMCKSPKRLYLKDEFGKVYPLKFDCEKCEMAVLD